MTLEDLIGSRLVFGIPGTTVTPEIVHHFQETHAGGLILYRIIGWLNFDIILGRNLYYEILDLFLVSKST